MSQGVINSSILNNCLEDSELQKSIFRAFREGSKRHLVQDHKDVSCSSHPFPHCTIKNFIRDAAVVQQIEDAMLKMDYLDKNNDLYKFKQTKALERLKEPAVVLLKSGLETVRLWLTEMFGVQLGTQTDMFAAQYRYTDTLLCHDDELEGRRFAYIYYLVPLDWKTTDGGTLDLFCCDEDSGLPYAVEKSIVPERNSLTFFEVSPKSFHQVSEVFSRLHCRLSIAGWFHGPSLPRKPYLEKPLAPPVRPVDIDEDTFLAYINPQYLSPETLGDIQGRFEGASEIQLQDFLSVEKYMQLCEDLQNENIMWSSVGPPIKQRFQVAEHSSLPNSIKECIGFFTSDAMFLTLSNMTGLKLHTLAASDSDGSSQDDDSQGACSQSKRPRKDSNVNTAESSSETGDRVTRAAEAGVRVQVRKWSHGDYTLIRDSDPEQGRDFALDAVMHFVCDGYEPTMGGYTSYIAKGEDEELMHIEPTVNNLALVYRDADTLRFVKHVNGQIREKPHQHIYDISLIYYESVLS